MISRRLSEFFEFFLTIPRFLGINRIFPENTDITQDILLTDTSLSIAQFERLDSLAMPEKITCLVADDIQADLFCEKVDDQWLLYLTAISGPRCVDLFGRDFHPNERIPLSQLMDTRKFKNHQRFVDEVLDIGPQAHNWTILFQRMYERPIKILNPTDKTEMIVDIRMELAQQSNFEIGRYYQFHVFLNHRTPEQACNARFNEILNLTEQLITNIKESLNNIDEQHPYYRIIQDSYDEIKKICLSENIDLQAMELKFHKILFYSNQIQLYLKKCPVAREDILKTLRLNTQIHHLCSFESLDIFSYLFHKMIYEQKIQQMLQRNIMINFKILESVKMYPLATQSIQTLDSLLTSLIDLYLCSRNDTETNEVRLESSVDLKKEFLAHIYLSDPKQKFFQYYQQIQTSHEAHDFFQSRDIWQNSGGKLNLSTRQNDETVFEFSIFSEKFKLKEFILNPDEIQDISSILEKIDYQNKKSILFADDGVVNIKFLLTQTLNYLGLGRLPERSSSSKLDFSTHWSKLGCYILSYADWYFICAPDGKMSKELMQQWLPNAIITDHEMPNLNGTQLIEWFREAYPQKNDVRIALHSANAANNCPEKLQNLNATFLTKADKINFKMFIDSVNEAVLEMKL